MFWKWVDKTQGILKVVGAGCLVGMMGLTCADVVGRYFGHPIFGSVELVGFMATMATALALPYTHEVKGHIGVEILVRVFPPRVQTWIDLTTALLSLVLVVLITWRMTLYAGTIKASGEVSMNLELPEYLIIYLVALCFFSFSLVILKDFVSTIRTLAGGK